MSIGSYNGSWVPQVYNLTPENVTHPNYVIVDASVATAVGLIVLLTILLSGFQIYKHLTNYTRPNQQRHIVRIILIVPLYAVCSYLSLFFHEYQTYFAIFRDCYEAYALWQFFALCLELANGWQNMEAAIVSRPERTWPMPFCCFLLKPSGKTLMWCQRGILQYALIRPLTTLASAVLLATGFYAEGEWEIDRGWLWLMLVNNICVSVSLYFIVLFYQLSRQELAPYHPLLKFSVIKGIVFFCYWQSILFAAIVWIPVVKFRDWDRERIAYMLQNLFICAEMFGFALLQWFAFPYAFYEIKAMSQAPLARPFELGGHATKSISHVLNQKDLGEATVDSFVPKKLRELTKKARRKKAEGVVDDDSEEMVDLSSSSSSSEGPVEILKLSMVNPDNVVDIQDDRAEDRTRAAKESREAIKSKVKSGKSKNKTNGEDDAVELEDFEHLQDDIAGKTDSSHKR